MVIYIVLFKRRLKLKKHFLSIQELEAPQNNRRMKKIILTKEVFNGWANMGVCSELMHLF